MMDRRKIFATTAAVGIAMTTSVLTSGVAQADPTGCYAYMGEAGAYARCSGGTGQVRVIAACAEDNPGEVRYGRWVGPDRNSIVFCSAEAASYQTRG